MYSFLLSKEIKEEELLPCYFFHGEETYLAYQFLGDLQQTLVSPDDEDYYVEKFNLEDHSWTEIMDAARTFPFFFSSWRILAIDIPQGKEAGISNLEKSVLEDYFSSPAPRTVLVIIYPGILKKNTSLWKLFASLPAASLFICELKPLKGNALTKWVERKLNMLEKSISSEAKRRLLDLTGNDLSLLHNEIEKIVTFVGEKKLIELDDVNQVSGLVKSYFEWEMRDSLEKMDLEQGLKVLNNLFKEGIKPEYILGLIVKVFRDISAAKILLKEGKKDRNAIFRELRPYIQEKFGNLYTSKFKKFFSLVNQISEGKLIHFFFELERIDLKIKTSDASPQPLMEAFLVDYCGIRTKGLG